VFSLYTTSVLRGDLRFLFKIDFLPIKKKKSQEASTEWNPTQNNRGVGVCAGGEEEPTMSPALTCLLTLINLFISILYFSKQDLDNTCKRTKKKEPNL
jgi:hypothetical protein